LDPLTSISQPPSLAQVSGLDFYRSTCEIMRYWETSLSDLFHPGHCPPVHPCCHTTWEILICSSKLSLRAGPSL
jgi:hypothetical protein